MIIAGAGLTGLMAGYVFPRATICEASKEPPLGHKALLRFRSDAVSRLTGIEFRKVRVRKGIFVHGEGYVRPSIGLANLYSRKCLGRLVGERSIWNLDPVDRWIAPEDFYDQMFDVMRSRIALDYPVNFLRDPKPIISTAPMEVALRECGLPLVEFPRQPITVVRAHVPDCDLHQTVYFPHPGFSLYRASITGNLLIAEFAGEIDENWWRLVMDAFGFDTIEGPLEEVEQHYGKIAPIDEDFRRASIARLTTGHNIYSVGRFATWRNILADDVVNDLAVIKRLIHSSHYEKHLAGARRP